MAQSELAAVRYAREFYNLLEQLSKPTDSDSRIFTGSVMEVYRSMGISNTHYATIRKLLLESGSIKILRQGTRSEPSLVEIVKPLPPPEEIDPEALTRDPPPATLAELHDRVSRLENWVDSLGGLNLREALSQINRELQRRG